MLDGAADYITKPFNIQELLARVTVQLRKNANTPGNIMKYLELMLDVDTHTVRVVSTAVSVTVMRIHLRQAASISSELISRTRSYSYHS